MKQKQSRNVRAYTIALRTFHKYSEAANTIPLRILLAACSNLVLSSMLPIAADACRDGVQPKHAASEICGRLGVVQDGPTNVYLIRVRRCFAVK